MAKLNQYFDAQSVEPNVPYETLPPGEYVVHIINSEMRDTKDFNGQYLWLDMQILDGQFANRHLYDRLNLINQNDEAVKIAQRTLSAICRAVNVLGFEDTEDLHFKPFLAVVKVRPAGKDKNGIDREAQNEIKGYKLINETSSSRPQQQPVPASAPPVQRQQPQNNAAVPPWRR